MRSDATVHDFREVYQDAVTSSPADASLESCTSTTKWYFASRKPRFGTVSTSHAAMENLSVLILAFLASHVAASNVNFDYIVAGGGPCGLLLANRLSEDPNVTVAVIEPGGDVRNNTNSSNPDNFYEFTSFDTPIDWAYRTVPQAKGANRSLTMHAGKAIGGSSTINGMTYIRADAAEIDAWETLGSPGWNWNNLLPYYKKVERFAIPTEAQLIVGASYEPEYHGEDGDLHVGFRYALPNGSFYPIVRDTWEKLGYQVNPDVNSGDTRGFDVWPQTVDVVQDVRWDAGRAYYYPVDGRSNLHMIQGTVAKILWKDDDDDDDSCDSDDKVASGIQYVDRSGTTFILSAEKEVILSTGALRTPLILEASGVGNTKLVFPPLSSLLTWTSYRCLHIRLGSSKASESKRSLTSKAWESTSKISPTRPSTSSEL